MVKEIIDSYLATLHEVYSSEEAREESFYPALDILIKEMWKLLKKKEARTVILPKNADVGNPDMVVRDANSRLAGYIEAKAPGKDLDKVEDSPQLERYRQVFPNLILTNFLEFRLYRFGRFIKRVYLCQQVVFIQVGMKLTGDKISGEKFLAMLRQFASYSLPRNRNAGDLAKSLAVRTRFFRDHVVIPELEAARNSPETMRHSHIAGFHKAFGTYLIHGLGEEEFADLYAQTLTFGLFTAAIRKEGKLERETAVLYIPQTSGILHDLFQFISLGNIPPQLECSLRDIVDVLNTVDTGRLLNEYYFSGKGDDPILHFYETFLSEYDRDMREKRGVYYTPGAVVSFIVRSIDVVLREKLNRSDGLADTGIKVLDPAAGTSTFLAETAKWAIQRYKEKYGSGGAADFAHHYLLNNIYGFEEMMAPYAVAHLKMSFILEQMGVRLDDDQRFNLYLTNTLDMEDIQQSNLPGMSSLSAESRLAGKVKKETPVSVVLGNPPYAGHSMNGSETYVTKTSGKKKRRVKVKTWIGRLIEDYKQIAGVKLQERNIKWLQDDYVKFIRFAQARIDETGEGVVGFITNHGYLDNPTFRGMRHSLMTSFDEIYILDLHGNALKREKCPDGSWDENVFDIRQGVAITLMIKKKDGGNGCKVFHADLWGSREHKYDMLAVSDISNIDWQELAPAWEFYLFTTFGSPADVSNVTNGQGQANGPLRYDDFQKVTDIFPVHSVGIITARDSLTIKETPEMAYISAQMFSDTAPQLARTLFFLGDDTRDWQLERAQQDLLDSGMKFEKITPILYRPFEVRYTYYTGKSRGYHCMPRPEVMKHMLKENTGLVTVRQVAEGAFSHSFITDTIIDSRVTSSNKGIAYLFPLYLYPFGENGGLFKKLENHTARQPNIHPKILQLVPQPKTGEEPTSSPTPGHILHYIYAILFSNIYREKYARYLKMDFPRIPFTPDFSLFMQVSRLGEKLAGLHLMRSPELDETVVRFEGGGLNYVKQLRFHERKVYINRTQYFSGISKEVWEYNLAGYQVLSKWLKMRKRTGGGLDHNRIKHFIRMVRCIELTIQCQEEIDRLYPLVEKSTSGT